MRNNATVTEGELAILQVPDAPTSLDKCSNLGDGRVSMDASCFAVTHQPAKFTL